MIANRSQRSSLYAEVAYGIFLLKINYFFWFNKYIKSAAAVTSSWLPHACLFWGTDTDALTLLLFSGNLIFPHIARELNIHQETKLSNSFLMALFPLMKF